jgi:hypothetical protein
MTSGGWNRKDCPIKPPQCHPPLAETDLAIENQWMNTTFILDNK